MKSKMMIRMIATALVMMFVVSATGCGSSPDSLDIDSESVVTGEALAGELSTDTDEVVTQTGEVQNEIREIPKYSVKKNSSNYYDFGCFDGDIPENCYCLDQYNLDGYLVKKLSVQLEGGYSIVWVDDREILVANETVVKSIPLKKTYTDDEVMADSIVEVVDIARYQDEYRDGIISSGYLYASDKYLVFVISTVWLFVYDREAQKPIKVKDDILGKIGLPNSLYSESEEHETGGIKRFMWKDTLFIDSQSGLWSYTLGDSECVLIGAERDHGEIAAYTEYMKNDPHGPNPCTLYDINNDGVRELIMYGGYISSQIVNCYNEKTELIASSKYGGFRIYPKSHAIWMNKGHMKLFGEEWLRVTKKGSKLEAEKEWELDYRTEKYINIKYKVKGKKASKTQYQEAVAKLKKGKCLRPKDFIWLDPPDR